MCNGRACRGTYCEGPSVCITAAAWMARAVVIAIASYGAMLVFDASSPIDRGQVHPTTKNYYTRDPNMPHWVVATKPLNPLPRLYKRAMRFRRGRAHHHRNYYHIGLITHTMMKPQKTYIIQYEKNKAPPPEFEEYFLPPCIAPLRRFGRTDPPHAAN